MQTNYRKTTFEIQLQSLVHVIKVFASKKHKQRIHCPVYWQNVHISPSGLQINYQ